MNRLCRHGRYGRAAIESNLVNGLLLIIFALFVEP